MVSAEKTDTSAVCEVQLAVTIKDDALQYGLHTHSRIPPVLHVSERKVCLGENASALRR